MSFDLGMLSYMKDTYIDPDGFPPTDHDLIVSIKAEIDAQIAALTP